MYKNNKKPYYVKAIRNKNMMSLKWWLLSWPTIRMSIFYRTLSIFLLCIIFFVLKPQGALLNTEYWNYQLGTIVLSLYFFLSSIKLLCSNVSIKLNASNLIVTKAFLFFKKTTIIPTHLLHQLFVDHRVGNFNNRFVVVLIKNDQTSIDLLTTFDHYIAQFVEYAIESQAKLPNIEIIGEYIALSQRPERTTNTVLREHKPHNQRKLSAQEIKIREDRKKQILQNKNKQTIDKMSATTPCRPNNKDSIKDMIRARNKLRENNKKKKANKRKPFNYIPPDT